MRFNRTNYNPHHQSIGRFGIHPSLTTPYPTLPSPFLRNGEGERSLHYLDILRGEAGDSLTDRAIWLAN